MQRRIREAKLWLFPQEVFCEEALQAAKAREEMTDPGEKQGVYSIGTVEI